LGGVATLYEWAGGEKAFERLMNAFYDRVEADELLAPCSQAGSAKSIVAT
jgi:hemoglobin